MPTSELEHLDLYDATTEDGTPVVDPNGTRIHEAKFRQLPAPGSIEDVPALPGDLDVNGDKVGLVARMKKRARRLFSGLMRETMQVAAEPENITLSPPDTGEIDLTDALESMSGGAIPALEIRPPAARKKLSEVKKRDHRKVPGISAAVDGYLFVPMPMQDGGIRKQFQYGGPTLYPDKSVLDVIRDMPECNERQTIGAGIQLGASEYGIVRATSGGYAQLPGSERQGKKHTSAYRMVEVQATSAGAPKNRIVTLERKLHMDTAMRVLSALSETETTPANVLSAVKAAMNSQLPTVLEFAEISEFPNPSSLAITEGQIVIDGVQYSTVSIPVCHAQTREKGRGDGMDHFINYIGIGSSDDGKLILLRVLQDAQRGPYEYICLPSDPNERKSLTETLARGADALI